MKNSKVVKALLVISGLIATGIGAATLFAPEAFLGTSGIDLGGQVSLLSEVRAPGAALFGSGIIILLGLFVANLTFTSTVIATLMFLAYGVGRIVGMAIDGMPVNEMVGATGLEVIIGLIGVYALLRYRDNG